MIRDGEDARDEVAGERGEHERDRARDEDPAADQLDVRLDVVERVDEHRDAADRRAPALTGYQRDDGDRLAPDRRLLRRGDRRAAAGAAFSAASATSGSGTAPGLDAATG